jgi:transcriptional regulator with XRE-family HTH domain
MSQELDVTRGPRHCKGCNARLASANLDVICWPCQRLSHGASHRPPAVPPDFWRTDEMRAAFEARHMGHIIRAYRLHYYHGRRPVSQEVMAQWLSVSQAQLSRIEMGHPIRDLDRLIQWARVLIIPLELLWFKMPAVSPAPQADQPDEPVFPYVKEEEDAEDIMRRRAFLLNMAVLAEMSRSDPITALEHVRRGFGHSFPDGHGADVSEWNEIALEYGETYAITAPAELLKSLILDFAGLQEAFERYPQEAVRQELYRVSALLAGFLAQTVNNLGHVTESRRWWRTARYASDRSGDSYSLLWVRGREIVHAMGERPAEAVLRLVEEAEQFVVGAPPELVLELLGGKAQTLAIAGRQPEAENTLAELRDRFSATSFGGYSGSLLAWGEERLRSTESFTYSRLGSYEEMENAQRAASALFKHAPSNVRWPTAIELNRAFCLTRNGDVTEGVAHARRVIAELPTAQQTQDIIKCGREVLNAIPQSEENRPVVHEYRDWLNSMFRAVQEREV